MPKETFMKYTTTIGNTIYIPFKVGDFTEKSFWAQKLIFPHELVHVFQYRKRGIMFFLLYLLSSTCRAYFEIIAYGVNMDMRYQLYGERLPPDWLAEKMRHYSCKKQKKVAEQFVKLLNKAFDDTPLFDISADCLGWLDSYDSLLRGDNA